jgi:hypothetical protein
MQRLTTDQIDKACRIFVSLAYPAGETTIPINKRHMLKLPPGLSIVDHLNVDSTARGCCQLLPSKAGPATVLLVRLGCCHYPNLKLKAQLVEDENGCEWLFTVDTHDAFSASCFLPPEEHPEHAAWVALQTANATLKCKIEAAWDEAGLLTFNGLLRRELPKNAELASGER